MIVVDPLKEKVKRLLVEGVANPLALGRERFGTEEDVRQTTDTFNKLASRLQNGPRNYLADPRQFIYIDITPFQRIGRTQQLVEGLRTSEKIRPVLLVKSDVIEGELYSKFKDIPISVVFFDEFGNETKTNQGELEADRANQTTIEKDIRSRGVPSNLAAFRRIVSDQNLTQILLSPGGLDIPTGMNESGREKYISGRYYFRMPNGMLITSFINIKELARNLDVLLTIAYELVLELAGCFCSGQSGLADFDMIVAPNNTALFISSVVQSITSIPVVPVDRLGPIPRLPRQIGSLRKSLFHKRVVIVEEVVATGSEIDRTVLFLSSLGAEISKIVGIYYLGVGDPMLPEPEKIFPLCKPREEIKYVYRSE